jgi:hypothetical protein
MPVRRNLTEQGNRLLNCLSYRPVVTNEIDECRISFRAAEEDFSGGAKSGLPALDVWDLLWRRSAIERRQLQI